MKRISAIGQLSPLKLEEQMTFPTDASGQCMGLQDLRNLQTLLQAFKQDQSALENTANVEDIDAVLSLVSEVLETSD